MNMPEERNGSRVAIGLSVRFLAPQRHRTGHYQKGTKGDEESFLSACNAHLLLSIVAHH